MSSICHEITKNQHVSETVQAFAEKQECFQKDEKPQTLIDSKMRLILKLTR